MSKYKWKDMVGHRLLSVNMPTDQSIVFATSKDMVMHLWQGKTEADCCSRTWINDLTVVPTLARDKPMIVAIIMSEINPAEPAYRKHDIKLYTFTVRTTHGDVTVDFRNESNGYYGGELVLTQHLENT